MAAPRRRLSSSPVVVLSRLGGAPHRVARLDPCRSLVASPVLWARGSGSRTCALQERVMQQSRDKYFLQFENQDRKVKNCEIADQKLI
ncbi:hypothetical protein TRIUR3_08507 [Triticum urartu]|uniref:Uncharacterized protein n=1 Tax=Triticum urartu TaxID=4572 RepID=M7ZLH1_TRIUA|nr:hypothetical protein TRIUR3_08507 [Triticum urartu]